MGGGFVWQGEVCGRGLFKCGGCNYVYRLNVQ